MQEKFDWEKAVLAKPGQRYQGQFIDGMIAIFLFAAAMFLFEVVAFGMCQPVLYRLGRS